MSTNPESPKKAAPKKAAKPAAEVTSERMVLVRIRGPVRVNQDMNDTMRMLHMERVNSCTVVPRTPAYMGMVRKVKDYITYGELDEATWKALVEKKSEPYQGRLEDSKKEYEYKKYFVADGKKIKPFFRLNPPRGGFERKGIKWSFKQGGALGYRGPKINDLIMRMI